MKKRNRIILGICLFALLFVAIWFFIALLTSLFLLSVKKTPLSWKTYSSQLLNFNVLLFSMFGFLIAVAGFFWKMIAKPRSKLGANRSASSLHDNARFMTEQEINQNYGNKATKSYKRFSNIENEEVDGLVISSKYKNGDILFNSASGKNSAVISTTGGGKTSVILMPSVELMARSKTKPSMVILDVKGEIHEKTNKNLIAQGYETHLVDLRNPSKSEKFNPFSLVSYYWDQYLKDPKNIVAKEKTNDLILQICSMFNPKMKGVNGGGSGDAYWDNAAMGVMEAYIWSLLENYEYVAYKNRSPFDIFDINGELDTSKESKESMAKIADSITGFGTKDGITFRALQDIANLDLKSYYKYLNNRPHTSQTYKTAHETIINMITFKNNQPEMQKPLLSLLSVYKTNYKRIISETIEEISSASSFDLKAMYQNNDRPFALYILMPDEDKNKYPFASIMISEIYQFFTSLSQEIGFKKDSYRRSVHFFMDEFANLNPMEEIDTYLSLGRQRKLFIHIFVQGLSQLNDKYGHQKANTILGNANLKIFMALSENEVIDYAVKLFGTYTVNQTSVSQSHNDGSKNSSSSASSSTSLGQANLINPSDLKKLKFGTIYFLETTKDPAKTHLLSTYDKELRRAFNYE